MDPASSRDASARRNPGRTVRVALDGKVLTGPPGGVRRYVEGLLGALPAAGGEVIRVETVVPERPIGTLRWTVGHLRRISARYDLLHCPFYYGPPASRCPVTVAIHDILPVEHPEWFPRAWASPLRWLLPRAARRAEIVVTDAEAVAERIEAVCRVDRRRIRVIPHGVDRRLFAPTPPEAVATARTQWADGRPYLLQVGAIEPRRGVDLAVRATAAVRVRYPDLRLLLVGPERAAVAALDPAPSWVVRPGPVDDAVLPALYAGAEAVLSPSRGEGFDLPLLEALACGAAVVASDIPVHVEHFEPAVRLFASGDADALAGALETVLADSTLRRKLRDRALAHAARFTWERSAREHAALWREIAG